MSKLIKKTCLSIAITGVAFFLFFMWSGYPFLLKKMVPLNSNSKQQEKLTAKQQLAKINIPQGAKELTEEMKAWNRGYDERIASLEADGWTVTEVEAPSESDEQVMNLDPESLIDREEDVKHQLLSTRISEKQLKNATTIAMNAENSTTRKAAIEAIGYNRSKASSDVLMVLVESLEDEKERSLALGFIHSNSLTDDRSQWMMNQLFSEDFSDELKGQIVHKLILTGLVESKGEEATFTETLYANTPFDWHDEIKKGLNHLNMKERQKG